MYTVYLKKEIMGSGAAFYVHGDLERTKRRRNRRTPFDKSQRYYKNNGNAFVFPKATEAQLEAIRKKAKKQRRLDTLKLVVSFVLAIPVIYAGLYYLGSILR
jgi:hypothetical protein